MRRRVPIWASFLVALIGLRAEDRALLIGVPSSPGCPESKSLEGPPNDVESLADALVSYWGFDHRSIEKVVGAAASRARVLEELDQLVEDARTGDHVIIYFSGHGISGHDQSSGSHGVDMRTGALVPADIQCETEKGILGQLIVGARDLRPRFERLDAAGAETLVLFDACYSGDTAKRVQGLVPRAMPKGAASHGIEAKFDEEFRRLVAAHAAQAEEWPYEKLIYVSAAARHELAWDIPSDRARSDRPTIDGNAHGAFTDGLLRALRGDADLDRDGQIAYSELHGYLVQRVQRDGQTPQLHARSETISASPLLGRLAPPRRVLPNGSRPRDLRVRIDPPVGELASLLRGVDGVLLTEGEFDLELRTHDHVIQAYHPSGAQIDGTYLTPRAAVTLVRRRAEAHRVSLVSYPEQDIRLDTAINPVQGVYFRGDRLSITMQPSESSWLMLLTIDAEGGIAVLYPRNQDDMRPVAAGEQVEALRVQAGSPFGTDLLEAFAWREKPPGYDRWASRGELLSENQMKDLLAMLRHRADRPGRVHVSRLVVTAGR